MLDSEDNSEKKEVEKISAAPSHEGAVAIDDPVKMYLKEIGSMRLLDSDEEIVLAKKVEKGSLPDATDEDKKEADDAKKELTETSDLWSLLQKNIWDGVFSFWT